MAENTQIEWCDHTFNPWRGCHKVSPGCDNCYAETLSNRNPATLGEWGKDANRVIGAESYWKRPEKWEREAEAFFAEHGRRQRVFCASLGDVFENRPDLAAPRLRLLHLIRRTHSLDWLLLTKRPKNVLPLLRRGLRDLADYADRGERPAWLTPLDMAGLADWLANWTEGIHPTNVWLGTSVEDQERADQRVPALLDVPAAVRFLSCEPLLGPVALDFALYECPECEHTATLPGYAALPGDRYLAPCCRVCSEDVGEDVRMRRRADVDWVIVGGESGPGARPMHPGWARSIRDQCEAAGVPFFFKQWGAFYPYSGFDETLDAFPDRPIVTLADGREMIRLGKKESGDLLDGYAHTDFPEPLRSDA